MNKNAPLNIQSDDTIRLKQSLKLGEQYDGFTFMDSMDYRPNRLTIREIDDNTVFMKGPDNYAFWYPFSMLDMRTLRKTKENLTNEQSV